MIDCRYAPEHLEILTAEEDIDFYHQVFLKIDENNRIIIPTMAKLNITESLDVVFSTCLKWHFAFHPHVLFSELDKLWQHLLG